MKVVLIYKVLNGNDTCARASNTCNNQTVREDEENLSAGMRERKTRKYKINQLRNVKLQSQDAVLLILNFFSVHFICLLWSI